LLFHCIVTNLHLPHDALFKFGFSDTERAADEFRPILPPALVHKIDWEALERIDGTELQSQADPMMPSGRKPRTCTSCSMKAFNKGMEKGRMEGHTQFLLDLLTLKFGH